MEVGAGHSASTPPATVTLVRLRCMRLAIHLRASRTSTVAMWELILAQSLALLMSPRIQAVQNGRSGWGISIQCSVRWAPTKVDSITITASTGQRLTNPFDPIAREEFVHRFYQFVDPLDGYDSNAGTRSNVQTLSVDTVDPAVIHIDWTVNGQY